MYEDQTQSAIRERMLGNITSGLDKREGSFIYDTLSPTAIELALAYAELYQVLILGFAQTSSGQYLDYRAGERGITRKLATKATGQITITGTANAQVPSGSLFATIGGIQFVTTASVALDSSGSGMAAVEAVIAGSSGNVPASTITAIPVSIAGVISVTNADITTGGTDIETDADLLERLLEKVGQPATSGNAAQYRQWTLEVPGVGDAKVFPLWAGPGTVKLVLVDAEKQPATSTLVETVANYIESVRPIGAAVTVVSAAAKPINASATVVLASGYTIQSVSDAFNTALEGYLKDTAFTNTYVSYAKVGTLLLSTAGVLDYTNLTVNSGNANIALADEEIPVLGTVELEV